MKDILQHLGGTVSRFLLRLLAIGLLTHAALFLLFDALPSADLKLAGWMAADPVALARYRESLGLGGSLLSRYLTSVGNLFRGDLGVTLSGMQVGTILAERFAVSMVTVCFSVCLVIIAVLVSALCRCSRSPSRGWRMLPLFVWFGLSPTLVMAAVAKGFALSLGWDEVFDSSTLVSSLAIGALAAMVPTAMLVSAAVSEAAHLMMQPFVTTLISQGRSDFSIRLRLLTNISHALRPLLGRAVLQLAGGVVFAELVWDVPGIGRVFAEGFQTADYALLQGWMLLVAALAFGCSTWEARR